MAEEVTLLLGPQAFWDDLITVNFNGVSSRRELQKCVHSSVRVCEDVHHFAELSRFVESFLPLAVRSRTNI